MPAKHDLVSQELRAAEREIDDAYRTNPLVAQPLPVAAWCVLAFCEEQAFRHFQHAMQGTSVHEDAAFADALVARQSAARLGASIMPARRQGPHQG